MLTAIGIYEFTHHEASPYITLKAIHTAFKSGFFFGENPLEHIFDKKNSPLKLTFDDVQETSLNLVKISHFQTGKEHLYITRFNDNHIVVILANRLLGQTEAYYLALNSSRVFNDSQKESGRQLGITLQNILNNYLGYTGKDCLIKSIQDDLEETKKIIQRDADILIERGEHLQRVESSVIKLNQTSEEFLKSAKELNHCCGIF